MNKNKDLLLIFVILTSAHLQFANAKESTLEKAETVKNKSVDSVKSTYRKVDDKVCEMINGKMNCVMKKVKNKVKNTTDKLDTKATETINKVD